MKARQVLPAAILASAVAGAVAICAGFVAFLGELPQLSPAEYQALTRTAHGPALPEEHAGGLERNAHGH